MQLLQLKLLIRKIIKYKVQTEAVFNNIAERIQLEISKAQKSIFIAVAWFTNQALFHELLNSAKKGCRVYLIISNDEINSNSLINYDKLYEYGKTHVFRIGSTHSELMHNKFCIIDYCTIITGSYNWSYKAENNYENIIITNNDISVVEQYISAFINICKLHYPETLKDIEDFIETSRIDISNSLLNLIPYRKKDKWGLCTVDKKIVIDCLYSEVHSLTKGLFRIKFNGKYGVINKRGDVIIPILYNILRDIHELVIAAKLNDKFGFVDINGKTVLPFVYDAATDFLNGEALVEIGGQIYAVDKSGSMERKSNDDYFFKIDDSGLLNRLSKSKPHMGWEIEARGLRFESFSLGDLDFINSELGSIQLPNEEVLRKSNGMIAFRKEGKYGFMNPENVVVIPPIYDDAFEFNEDGISLVKINNKLGYINKSGIQFWED